MITVENKECIAGLGNTILFREEEGSLDLEQNLKDWGKRWARGCTYIKTELNPFPPLCAPASSLYEDYIALTIYNIQYI